MAKRANSKHLRSSMVNNISKWQLTVYKTKFEMESSNYKQNRKQSSKLENSELTQQLEHFSLRA